MALTIEQTFLEEVKNHIRVYYTQDDDLIKSEIEVAANNIWTQFCLKDISKLTSTADLTANMKLAVKHYVAMLRSNPDERIETKDIVIDKRLIQKILGKDRGY